MKTDLTRFTEAQRQALLDLVVLAMYADGNLAVAEDAQVQRLLAAMGLDPEHEGQRHCDASVARARQHAQTPEAARTHAATLARSFTTPEQRGQVCGLLEELAASDGSIAAAENSFLSAVRDSFKV